MEQLNDVPRKAQAEAAPGAVRGTPLWKGWRKLIRD